MGRYLTEDQDSLLPRSVFIKGGPEEDLVLCTSDSTYTLRFVESSNTMLLASASAAGGGPPVVRVQGSVGGIMEVRLKELLYVQLCFLTPPPTSQPRLGEPIRRRQPCEQSS